MRLTEKELLMQYILNNHDYYENDLIQLRQRIRFRNIDVNDCVELQLAIERLACFEKFSKDIMALLNLRSSESDS